MSQIAIDHAWAGLPGTLFKSLSNGTVEVWAKPLPGREVAVLVLNAGLDNVTLSLSLEADVPGRPQGATVRDVWNHADVAVPPTRRLALSLHAHDSSLLVLQQTAQERWW